MFSNFKRIIKELAHTAVLIAEEKLGSKTGQLKKEMAINYITENLPLPLIIKPLIANLLSGFIDETIEFAVMCIKKENNGVFENG